MTTIRDLLHQLADAFADRMEQSVVGHEYYDQDTSPLPAATHCRLVRRGVLPGFRVNGRVLVERSAMRAYIESRKVTPMPSNHTEDVPPNEALNTDTAVSKILDKLGMKRGHNAA